MKSNINYIDQWRIEETNFNQEWLGKYEAIMSQGNGYLGLRAATEESYVTETRNLFVAGTFNKFSENEVTELPNIPDITNMTIFIDGERLDLNTGDISNYTRTMNYKSGELYRRFKWTTTEKKQLQFEFKRSVSNVDLHFIKQSVKITPIDNDVIITVISGIDGRVNNSGAQHFIECDKRKKKNILQMNLRTTESNVDVTVSTKHQFFLNNQVLGKSTELQILRRQIFEKLEEKVVKGSSLVVEKTSSVYTSRDFDYTEMISVEEKATQKTLEFEKNYDEFCNEVKEKWSQIYRSANILIESEDFMDQLLMNFSRYHLLIMTHPLDNRVNIGAKGLSGEGYKGHTFWDTEIFILPFFIYSYPDIAKNLIEYRYKILPGARKKAANNNYLGAQIPWECAWIDDGEVTPLFGDVDIVTGAQTKILTGLIEDHVSSDVVYGMTQYLRITGQQETLEYKQFVLETALFWTTRASLNDHGQYEILDVIGPDEYKEHVDNNTYTNTMAKFNVDLGIAILKDLSDEAYNTIQLYLNHLDRNELLIKLKDFSDNIFIHSVNENNILPQDDSYLKKENLNIETYKESPLVNEIFKEFNLDQINEFQVSKQADILLLMTIFFEDFTSDEIKQNFTYYEKRTLHDSSLSLSTHSILASLLGNTSLAYEFFKKLITIDLGKNMHSSDQGIHSASMGGVWQSVVLGFGGLKYDMSHQQLHINPKLPENWQSLTYQFYYQGNKFEVNVTQQAFKVTNLSENDENVDFYYQGDKHSSGDKINL